MHFAREKHANEGSKGQFCSLGQRKIHKELIQHFRPVPC